jgi:TonB family protein
VVLHTILLFLTWCFPAAQVQDSTAAFDVEASLSLAIGYSTEGEFDKAIDLLSTILARSPNHVRAHYQLGVVQHELNRYDEALRSFQTAIELRPTFLKAHCGLMGVYIAMVEVEKAMKHFGETLSMFELEVQLHPDSAEAPYQLGHAYRLVGNYTKAVENYQLAIARDNTHATAMFDLALTYQIDDELDKAIEMYRNAIQRKPDFALAYFCLGTAHSAKGELGIAVECWQKSIRLDPSLETVSPVLSHAQATREIEQHVEKNPNDVMARHDLGTSYMALGELDKAIEQFEATIDLEPEFSYPYLNLGIVHHLKNDFDEAIECFEDALKIKADYVEVYLAMAESYLKRGVVLRPIGFLGFRSVQINDDDMADAERCFQKVIDLVPSSAYAHYGLGRVYLSKDEYDKAIAQFERALDLKEDMMECYFLLAETYNLKYRTSSAEVTTADDQAIQCYDRAKRIDPENPTIYYNLGKLYSEEYSIYKPAIENLRKAISLSPRYAAAHRELAIALYKQGDAGDATELIRKAIYLGDRSALWSLLTWYWDEIGDGGESPSETDYDVKPTIVSRVDPQYPKEALVEGLEGKVRVKVLVGKQGRASRVLIAESSNKVFNYPAREASKRFVFKPAYKDQEPVAVWVSIPFSFTLTGRKQPNPKEEPPPDSVAVTKMPQITKEVKPIIPQAAIDAGVNGKVKVKLWIGRDGKPRKAEVVESVDKSLDQSCVDAAMQFEFTPAMMGEEAVAVWVTIPFVFTTKNK